MNGLSSFVSALSAFTFVFQLWGAGRTFVLESSERPSLRHFAMPMVFIATLASTLFNPLRRGLAIPGIVGLLAAMALFDWARRSVRGHRFKYIFSRGTPGFLWTGGPFRHVRNPFYTSYLLSATSVALMRTDAGALFLLVVLYVLIGRAARQEEARFLASPLEDDYRAYAARTGRFVPWLGRLPKL